MNPVGFGLASRLSRVLSIWVGSIWILGVVGVAWFVHNKIATRFDNVLAISGHRLLEFIVYENLLKETSGENLKAPETQEVSVVTTKGKVDAQILKPRDFKTGTSNTNAFGHMFYQAFDEAGHLIFRSEAAPHTPLLSKLEPGFSNVYPWRTYVVYSKPYKIYVLTAEALDERAYTQRSTLLWLLLPLLFLMPLLSLVVYKLTRRELRGIEHIASEIATRGGSNLSPIPLMPGSSELNTITTRTNQLLHRLEDALQTERSLASNAAHELRTPLATARLALGAAQALARNPEVQASLEQVAASLDTLSRRAEKLLQLSRAESASTLSFEEVDLAVLALMVTQEFWHNPNIQSRLKLNLSQEQAVITRGNFDTIAIALRNLIENALKYAPEGQIYVSVIGPASIRVRDEGEGVAAENLSKLQQRHVRLETNLPGYGLGMSIVRTILEKNGGSLELHSPPVGYEHGFEAILKFKPSVDV